MARSRKKNELLPPHRVIRSLIEPLPEPEVTVQRICDLILDRLNTTSGPEDITEENLRKRMKIE
jgi:hypothetical protein